MTTNPFARLEIRMENSDHSIRTSKVTYVPIVAANTWQHVSTAPFPAGAAVLGQVFPGFSMAKSEGKRTWDTANQFWTNGASFTDGVNGELLGANQVDGPSTVGTYPAWGSNTNIATASQSATHEQASIAAWRFNPTAANTTESVAYPTTTAGAAEYKTVIPGNSYTFSFWVYWGGHSLTKQRSCLL
jgi:hypothetical protein